jgi:hypothetical protein
MLDELQKGEKKKKKKKGKIQERHKMMLLYFKTDKGETPQMQDM